MFALPGASAKIATYFKFKRKDGMTSPDLNNITCAQFAAMPLNEQQAFVIGVANGRGMTAGLFRAYAVAAQNFASTADERVALETSFATINSMLLPLLEIDACSLHNGLLATCNKPDFRDEYVINALASVHLDIAKALKQQHQQGGVEAQ